MTIDIDTETKENYMTDASLNSMKYLLFSEKILL